MSEAFKSQPATISKADVVSNSDSEKTASLVNGIISKIKKEKNINKVIATGGLANVFSRDTSIFDKIDLRLTIKGLVLSLIHI